MKYHFAMALETEMPRLNDAGVHRTHGNFVHFFALDLIEVGHADERRFAVRAEHRSHGRRRKRLLKTNWFPPRVAFGADAELLADFGVDYFQGYYFGEPVLSPAWMEPDTVAAE